MKFEKVSKYSNSDIKMPERKTQFSAGYDMVAAEDYIIPSYLHNVEEIKAVEKIKYQLTSSFLGRLFNKKPKEDRVLEMPEMADTIKQAMARPTLVSTGMKCQLDAGYYLELSARSSSPLKYLLILANGVGIIDADYYNNSDNEGEIFFQFINLSPYPIKIKKGEAIGQAIIKRYHLAENDNAYGKRVGGFGSTNK